VPLAAYWLYDNVQNGVGVAADDAIVMELVAPSLAACPNDKFVDRALDPAAQLLQGKPSTGQQLAVSDWMLPQRHLAGSVDYY
jgi:hypothetical protein